MNFDLSEEQMMIRDSAERAVRQFCALSRRRERIARGESFDAEFWSQFAELGWLALCVPESEGGLGGGMVDVALLMIELGRGASSEPIVSSAVLSAGLLIDVAWEGRHSWVENVLSGQARLAFASTEDGDRLDLPAPRATRLERCGEGFVLTGAKLLVFDGEGAAGYVVVTSIADSDELALVMVTADAPGLTVRSYPLHDGSRAADLFFDRLELPADAVVAQGGHVAGLVEDALARASLMSQAAAIGSMEACLELCRDYAATRAQFGQPIGKFQAIQHMMSDMLVAAHNARSMLYYALSRFDSDRAERTAAVAASKVAIGRAGLMVSRAGIQIHGGYGMTDEFAIGHHHRYQFVLEKRFGDAQAHAAFLAGSPR